MHTAGSQSWRLSESASQLLTIAVYVRDVHALPVPAFDAAPPMLLDPPPPVPGVLDDSERALAGAQWPSWWDEILDVEIRSHAAGVTSEERKRLSERRRALGDPADLSALADRLELRTAIAATFEAAVRLTNERRRESADSDGAEWPEISDVVEQVAFDRGVDAGELSATMLTIDVEGPWWHVVAPGACVCSTDFAADRRTAIAARYTTFASALS